MHLAQDLLTITRPNRGQDLFDATPIQRVLQALLELPAPTYRHHPLLLGADGKRFAKRDRSETLPEMRAAGMSAAQVIDGLRL